MPLPGRPVSRSNERVLLRYFFLPESFRLRLLPLARGLAPTAFPFSVAPVLFGAAALCLFLLSFDSSFSSFLSVVAGMILIGNPPTIRCPQQRTRFSSSLLRPFSTASIFGRFSGRLCRNAQRCARSNTSSPVRLMPRERWFAHRHATAAPKARPETACGSFLPERP